MHANFTRLGRLKLWTRCNWKHWVRTMYKRKDRKVHPKNVALPDGIKPGGKVAGDYLEKIGDDLEEAGDGDDLEKVGVDLEIGGGLKVPRGSLLTPARLEKMKIGVGFLTGPERKLFIDILYEFEGAIAFEDSEMGLVKPEIETPRCHSHCTPRTLATKQHPTSEIHSRCGYGDRQRKTETWGPRTLARTVSFSLLP
jgi:hypothetical protein